MPFRHLQDPVLLTRNDMIELMGRIHTIRVKLKEVSQADIFDRPDQSAAEHQLDEIVKLLKSKIYKVHAKRGTFTQTKEEGE